MGTRIDRGICLPRTVCRSQDPASFCVVEVNLEYRYDTEDLRTKSGHPTLESKSGNSTKFLEVVGHDRQVICQCGGCNLQFFLADGNTPAFQINPDGHGTPGPLYHPGVLLTGAHAVPESGGNCRLYTERHNILPF
jgi:hypothetical protein